MTIYQQLLLQATYRNQAGDGDGGGGGESADTKPDGDAGGEGAVDGADTGEESLAGGEDVTAADAKRKAETPDPSETDGTTSLAGGDDGDDGEAAKGGDEKADGEGEEKGGAPEGGYSDFDLPEGFEIPDEMLQQFTDVAAELQLDQAGAQKFVELGVKQAQTIQAAVHSEYERNWQATQQAHIKAIRQDPELGGDNYPETVSLVRKGRAALAGKHDPEVRAWFNTTGIGNHPLMARMLRTVGRWVDDDKVLGEGKGGSVDAAAAMFPTMAEDES